MSPKGGLAAGFSAILVVAALVVFAGGSFADDNSHHVKAVAAGKWLAGQLVDDAMPGFAGPDWGLTIDALFGLTASGADPAARQRVVDNVGRHVRSYDSYDDYGIPGVTIAGAAAKILVAAVAGGANPRSFGGYDMRTEVLGLIATSGPMAGRVRDKGLDSDNSNTFGQSLAVIGLARSGGVPRPAVDFLIMQQCAAGGFRLSPDMFGTPSPTCDSSPDAVLDPDSTGMAVQALLAAAEAGATGAAESAAKGAAWLQQIQKPDGSFGGSGPTAASNTNSTGLAGQALAAAGKAEPAAKAAHFVSTMALTTENAGAASKDVGGIAYNAAGFRAAVSGGIDSMSGDQWRRATAQAMLALAGVSLGDLGKQVGPSPSTSPSPSLSPSPASSSPSATPSTSTSTTTTPTATATPTTTTTATATATATNSPTAGLPITGASLTAAIASGAALVSAGLILLLWFRRQERN